MPAPPAAEAYPQDEIQRDADGNYPLYDDEVSCYMPAAGWCMIYIEAEMIDEDYDDCDVLGAGAPLAEACPGTDALGHCEFDENDVEFAEVGRVYYSFPRDIRQPGEARSYTAASARRDCEEALNGYWVSGE